jgi:tetratricopeptide (TPR) repeat protein
MKIESVLTPYFYFDGRGCSLARWIYDTELLLPDSQSGFAPLDGSIEGAQYFSQTDDGENESWIIFHGLQVIQIVPEEVHSYWHLNLIEENHESSGVWEVKESEWIKTFSPRHLGNHKHFIIEFYDELIELICRELIFGGGVFDIEKVVTKDYRFAYAYLRRAMAQKKSGNNQQAVEYFQKYIDICPNGISVSFARKSIKNMQTGSAN